jgi:hypothetical protein
MVSLCAVVKGESSPRSNASWYSTRGRVVFGNLAMTSGTFAFDFRELKYGMVFSIMNIKLEPISKLKKHPIR